MIVSQGSLDEPPEWSLQNSFKIGYVNIIHYNETQMNVAIEYSSGVTFNLRMPFAREPKILLCGQYLDHRQNCPLQHSSLQNLGGHEQRSMVTAAHHHSYVTQRLPQIVTEFDIIHYWYSLMLGQTKF